MWAGLLFALAAGLMWGLVFVAPLMLPQYSAASLSVGRYLAFGLVALPLAWLDRAQLSQLSRADWLEATKLTLVGNFLYYLLLAAAIQQAGGPLPTMIIGTLPVVIAITANLRDAKRDGRLPWLRLAPSLSLIALGIALVNQSEWALLTQRAGSLNDYWLGALLAIGAVICWTWYPLRNADWLRAQSKYRSAYAAGRAMLWATAQGLVTLPLALLAGLLLLLFNEAAFPSLSGAKWLQFVGLMFVIGLFSSWLGTLCWNAASQRLPTTVVGQLIVFETLAALTYIFLWRGVLPTALTGVGIVLLVVGVLWALRVRPEPLTVPSPLQ